MKELKKKNQQIVNDLRERIRVIEQEKTQATKKMQKIESEKKELEIENRDMNMSISSQAQQLQEIQYELDEKVKNYEQILQVNNIFNHISHFKMGNHYNTPRNVYIYAENYNIF